MAWLSLLCAGTFAAPKPNIVLILADDMGWSDIGCYGGEIPTPNLDALASAGLRFTQFYNTARCSPTRAALLTGLHPHQTGMGVLGEDPDQKAPLNAGDGYTRFLNHRCLTIAEALKPAGYHSYMAGKWHLGLHGQEKWPLQRGFDRFYGILAGAASYLRPAGGRGLTLDNSALPPPDEANYYTTDAFADHALQFLREQKDDAPFFLYLAFNAPHWPLHARAEDIAKFTGKYRDGWDQLRAARQARMIEKGIVSKDWPLSIRDDGARAWDALSDEQKTQLDYRMAVYAAQVHRLDWNVGRVVAELRESGRLDNTLVLFLSDNGGCAEPYKDLGGGTQSEINDPAKSGSISYGTGWANASNTPFRKFKSTLYEGGIASPLIVHWPAGLKTKPGTLTPSPGYLTDVMPTVLELAGAEYPAERDGEKLPALAGKSLVPIFQTGTRVEPEWFFWEQYENRAVRHGTWKAVRSAKATAWELYDLAADRVEQHDLAAQHREIVSMLTTAWDKWAVENQVLPKKKNGTPGADVNAAKQP